MKIRDFRKETKDNVVWYVFRFGGGDDFNQVLEAFKRLVPLEQRFYSAEGRVWGVTAAFADQEAPATALEGIFENWRNCVEEANAQLTLPGF